MSQPSFSKNDLPLLDSVTNCSKKGNVYFLAGENPVPNKDRSTESIQLENGDQHLQDIVSMTATELKKKYLLTYDAWKNMKQRCKGGYILDQRFADFKGFLKHMGPRLKKEYTLDRLDYENPNYSPGNCRWADKYTQNQNKGNNIFLTLNGEKLTVSAWAHRTGQKPDTLHHRKAKGWTDEEIIKGKNSSSTSQTNVVRVIVATLSDDKLLYYLESQWRSLRAQNSHLGELHESNPDASPPSELVAKHAAIETNYWKLLNEVKKRCPTFDVVGHFRG